jgi:N-methylhydantoinase B
VAASAPKEAEVETIDPILLAVLGNRFESIVREMTNTLLRTGRSAVLSLARDFSCSLVTSGNELLASAEGCPVHVIGSEALTTAMQELQPDFAEGDAFLHNDPYMGNTHAADHTIMVPVFFEGEHMFTACAKAHVADCGNSQPTTYMPAARDVYEEGALIFPCVRIQRDFSDVADIVRMCKRRIRVPGQWYGDYLAQLGAARIAERRLKELLERYGREAILVFIREWFDYSERKMVAAIGELPSGSFEGRGMYDPFPAVPEGVALRVGIRVDAQEGRIDADLTGNPANVAAGINQSETTARNHVITGIFNSLDPDIPHNAGSMRRISVELEQGSVAGAPIFPASCSVATTNVGDRLVNMTQAAFADFSPNGGSAEGGTGMGAGFAVISGTDERHGDRSYINQVFIASQGGGANAHTDGWLTYLVPPSGGVMYKDSIEMDELKYPILVRELSVIPDSGGAGRRRGAPGSRCVYGPRGSAMRAFYIGDGHVTPPRGVGGGRDGRGSAAEWIDSAGERHELPSAGEAAIGPGAWLVGIQAAGGGYGDPLEREPDRVAEDVRQGYVTEAAARELYGVVVSVTGVEISVDLEATEELRASLKAGGGGGPDA